MIDYILVPQKLKGNLVDARSYSNLETSSDHRLVICKIKVADYLIHKKKNKNIREKYDTQRLIHNEQVKEGYAKTVEDNRRKTESNME